MIPPDQDAIGSAPWGWVPPEWDDPQLAASPPPVDVVAPEPVAPVEIPAPAPALEPFAYATPSEQPDVPIGNVTTAPDWSGLSNSLAAPDALPGYPAEPTAEEAALNNTEPTDAQRFDFDSERFASMDPIQLARAQVGNQLAAEEEAAAARLVAAKRLREDAEIDELAYRKAVQNNRAREDAVNALVEQSLNEKVDPDGWRNSRTLSQSIAGFVAGVVGGLVQSRKGGSNPGIDMIDKAIDQHIDAQKANIAHRRELLGMKQKSVAAEAERIEQDRLMEDAFRKAEYMRTIDYIETQKLNFNPAGTRALKLETMKRELIAHMAEADRKRALENEERMWKREKHNAEMAKLQARGGGGGGTGGTRPKPGEIIYTPEQVGEMFKDLPAPAGGWPAMNAAQVGAVALNMEKVRTVNKETESDKLLRAFTIPDLNGDALVSPDENGKPVKDWFIGKDDEAAALRASMEKTDNVIRMIDELRDIRRTYGGSSSWIGSDEEKRSNVLQANIFAAIKSGMEGMSSDADGNRMLAMAGASNPTSFRDQDAALAEGREQMLAGINAKLTRHGYKGKPITIADSYRNKPKKTADELALDAMIKDTTSPMKFDQKAPISDELKASIERKLASTIKLSDAHRKKIDEWASAAVGFDPAPREAKYTLLTELARRTRSQSVLEYVENVLKNVDAAREQLDSVGGQ